MTPPPDSHYWLGGSPCAGKSSVAELLAVRHGLTHFKCDDHFDRHLAEGTARGFLWSTRVRSADAEAVFLRSPEENLRLAWELYREHAGLICEETGSLPGPLLVEGAQLQPAELIAHGVRPDQVFYLIPTEEFQRKHYAQRTWAPERVAGTSNPVLALENWMQRDAAYARRIAEEAARFGCPFLWIDGRLGLEAVAARVARHWNLPAPAQEGKAPGKGPSAPT